MVSALARAGLPGRENPAIPMRTATASAAGPAFPSFSGMPGLIVSLGIVLDGAAVAAPGERRRPIAPTPLATS